MCQLYVSHISYSVEDKIPSLEYCQVLKGFKDVFPDEVPRLFAKGEIYFTVNLGLGASPVSKTPYRMSTLELAELKK